MPSDVILPGPRPSVADPRITPSYIVGRALRYEDVPDEEVASTMRERGAPAALVDAVAELNGLLRSGRLAIVTDEIARITRRPARSFREWARSHRESFTPSTRSTHAA